MPWDRIEAITKGTRDGGIRSRTGRLLDFLGLGWLLRRKPAHHTAVFTSAFIALAAKMAKADGVAVTAEWKAFERFLEMPPKEIANVKRLYDLAKEDAAGFEPYAERIGALLANDAKMKRDCIECLLYVACSDGILHPAEDAFVSQVAAKFGFTEPEFRRIRSMFVRDADSPYEILGVTPDATLSEIKSRYRQLAAEHHPDRLVAAGAPAALVKAANAKLAAINAAHEAIVKERTAGGRP